MCVWTSELNSDLYDTKIQRASRRAASLAKDRAVYQARKDAKTTLDVSPKALASIPHGAARSATRSGLAKQQITGDSEMPKLSGGNLGNHRKRWAVKPSVSKMLLTGQSSLVPDAVVLALPVSASSVHDSDFGGVASFEQTQPETHPETTPALSSDVQFPGSDLREREAAMSMLPHIGENVVADLTIESNVAVEADQLSEACLQECCVRDGNKTQPDQELWETSDEPEAALVEPPTLAQNAELDEWVVVTSSSSTSAPAGRPTKRSASRSARSASARRRAGAMGARLAIEIDWSNEGIPVEVKRQLLHASRDASHRSLHESKQVATPIPIKALRSQSVETRRKEAQSMTSAIRQRSKPRMLHQSSRKC